MWDKILKYKTQIIVAVIVIVVVIVVLLIWKKKEGNPVKVVDDNGHAVTFTNEQKAQALGIADRIYKDLNSGWLFGSNIWSIGRDDEAYNTLAQMSDSMFSLTYGTYRDKYNSSLITDLRAEASLDGRDYTEIILLKAEKLSLS